MINVKRSYPAPPSLQEEKDKEEAGVKKDGSYTGDDVVNQLGKDFKDKCYLCESNATTFNVEHHKSHQGNLDLKFDWENLFLSCGHCNT